MIAKSTKIRPRFSKLQFPSNVRNLFLSPCLLPIFQCCCLFFLTHSLHQMIHARYELLNTGWCGIYIRERNSPQSRHVFIRSDGGLWLICCRRIYFSWSSDITGSLEMFLLLAACALDIYIDTEWLFSLAPYVLKSFSQLIADAGGAVQWQKTLAIVRLSKEISVTERAQHMRLANVLWGDEQ